MKGTLKYITMTLLTIEIALICLFLPSQVSKWLDQRSFGSVHLENTEDIKVERDEQMSILEKLNLFINQKNTSNLVKINQGKYLKEEEIPEICERELKKLKELGVFKDINAEIKSNTLRIQPAFYLSMEDPTNSMIVWNVDYNDGKSYISLCLDDETGKILSFIEKTDQQIINPDVDTFMTELGQYYGVTVDAYNVKKTMTSSKIEAISQISYVIATFSEEMNQLSFGIQIYSSGWNYFEN